MQPDLPSIAISGGGLGALCAFGWWFVTKYLARQEERAERREEHNRELMETQAATFQASLEKVTTTFDSTLEKHRTDRRDEVADLVRRISAKDDQIIQILRERQDPPSNPLRVQT